MARQLADDTVLRRARNLRLRIDSDEIVYVLKHGGVISCGRRGLAILDAFSVPTPLGEALDRIGGASTQDEWMDITSSIIGLHGAGVLLTEEEEETTRAVADGTFADPMVHAMMLNDRRRTSTFIDAVHDVVQPGDIVVDIGTGTGVLAVAAARAGAGHVYAIEASGIAQTARRVFAVNALADRITLVEGWSTDLELAQLGDVLVSEIIGEMPLEERVLETTLDARHRLLKPDAHLIPQRLRIVGEPISIPSEHLSGRIVQASTIGRWRSWYGIDLSPVADASHGLGHMIYIDREAAAALPVLGPSVVLADIDLGAFETLQVESETTVQMQSAGSLNGVLISFEVDLGNDRMVSSRPEFTDERSSWRNVAWFFNESIDIEAGDRTAIEFTYRAPGRRNGVRIRRE
jgi:SAM-dependent methyltransferase